MARLDTSIYELSGLSLRLLQDEKNSTCVSPIVDGITPGFQKFSKAYSIICIGIALVSCYWWYLRRDVMYLKRRSASILFPLLWIFLSSNILAGPMYRATSENQNLVNECAFTNFVFLMVAPPVVALQVIRLLLFRNRVRFNRKVAEAFEANKPSMDSASAATSFDTFSEELQSLKYRSSSRFGVQLAVLFIVLFTLFSFTYSVLSCSTFIDPERDCEFSTVGSLATIFFLTPIVLTAVLQYWVSRQTKGEPDPFGILREIRWSYVVPLVLVAFSILFNTFDVGGFASDELVPFTFSVITDFAVMYFFIYSVPYRVYLSYQKQTNLYLDVKLSDILASETGSKLFEQHLVHEFSAENLTFWKAVKKWKETYDQASDDSHERTARNIYNRWLKPGSLLRINVSHRMAIMIQNTIENNRDEGIPKDAFDEVENEVYLLMSDDSFHRFKSSDLFLQYYGLEDPTISNVTEIVSNAEST